MNYQGKNNSVRERPGDTTVESEVTVTGHMSKDTVVTGTPSKCTYLNLARQTP